MERFAVGRSSIREALHSLVAMGMLESRAGKGYFATQPVLGEPLGSLVGIATSQYEFEHIREARRELELVIARLAIERATSEDFERLEETHRKIVEAAKKGENLRHQTSEFHLAIARMTHNPVLVQLLGALVPSLKATESQRLPDDDHLRLHGELVEAIRQRDLDLVLRLTEQGVSLARPFDPPSS